MSIRYQRNQVEAAIARTLDPRSLGLSAKGDSTFAIIQSRAKRLLDADRSMPTASGHAFYSSLMPGTGNTNSFSFLDAFMLMTGLCLNGHFWPQTPVIEVLRRARPTLNRELKNILALDPKWLFDPAAIAKVPDSHMEKTNARQTLFIVATDGGKSKTANVMFRVTDPNSAFQFMLEKPGRSATTLSIVEPALDLRKHLSTIEPAKRGRS